MLGRTIDYHLLKPLTHSRNRATEEDLDANARKAEYTLEDARAYLWRMQHEYFPDRFPIDPSLSYLDIGCGMGRLSLGLVDAGAEDVTGIDIIERHVEEASILAETLLPGRRPAFHYADVHEWKNERQYDVLITLGAMEHIHDPRDFLFQLRDLLTPNGRAFVSFEPFHSPLGDHMSDFFRVPVPWRGLLFSEAAILRLRAERYRPSQQVDRYQDIDGGLNLMRFREYRRWAEQAGLEFIYDNFNPQLKTKKLLRVLDPVSRVLTRIPRIQDYFGVCIFSVLRRRE
jgi:2-polyprenyl-3-methyl-5-hydroxy-6-metoxy-1,4-benzoquinol methylase